MPQLINFEYSCPQSSLKKKKHGTYILQKIEIYGRYGLAKMRLVTTRFDRAKAEV